RFSRDWSSDVCSSDLAAVDREPGEQLERGDLEVVRSAGQGRGLAVVAAGDRHVAGRGVVDAVVKLGRRDRPVRIGELGEQLDRGLDLAEARDQHDPDVVEAGPALLDRGLERGHGRAREHAGPPTQPRMQELGGRASAGGLLGRAREIFGHPGRAPALEAGMSRRPQPDPAQVAAQPGPPHSLAPKSTLTFDTPNASELLSTRRVARRRCSSSIGTPSDASTGSAPTLAGSSPRSMVAATNTASVAPAAPSMWPV